MIFTWCRGTWCAFSRPECARLPSNYRNLNMAAIFAQKDVWFLPRKEIDTAPPVGFPKGPQVSRDNVFHNICVYGPLAGRRSAIDDRWRAIRWRPGSRVCYASRKDKIPSFFCPVNCLCSRLMSVISGGAIFCGLPISEFECSNLEPVGLSARDISSLYTLILKHGYLYAGKK